MTRFGFLTALTLILASPAEAAWSRLFFPPSKSTLPEVKTFESKDYLVLFAPTGAEQWRKDDEGKNLKWKELGFKFVAQNPNPRVLFGEQGQMELRFLDKKNRILVSLHIGYQELEAGGASYGFLWVEEGKIKKIESVEIFKLNSLKSSDLGPKKSARPADKEMVPESVPSQQGEISSVEVQGDFTDSDSFSRPGITNEEVQFVLAELDSRPTTSPEVPLLEGAVTEHEIKNQTQLDRLASMGQTLTLTVEREPEKAEEEKPKERELKEEESPEDDKEKETETESKDKVKIKKEFQ